MNQKIRDKLKAIYRLVDEIAFELGKEAGEAIRTERTEHALKGIPEPIEEVRGAGPIPLANLAESGWECPHCHHNIRRTQLAGQPLYMRFDEKNKTDEVKCPCCDTYYPVAQPI